MCTWSTAAVCAVEKYAWTGMPWALAHSSEGEQYGRGAVGQRGGVAGGHRALGAAEHRLELGQLFHAGVRAQVLVALEAEEGNDQIVHPADVVGGGQVVMARHGQFVLGLAVDAPVAGHERGVLAHRHPGPRLGVARDLRHQLAGAQPREELQAPCVGLRAVELEQQLA